MTVAENRMPNTAVHVSSDIRNKYVTIAILALKLFAQRIFFYFSAIVDVYCDRRPRIFKNGDVLERVAVDE
jgi:hypothetical protein